MISRYEAYMDGIALGSIHPSIYVRDIHYAEPSFQFRENKLGYRDGALLDGKYLEKSSVTIDFDLRAYDTAQRQRILADIITWSKGSTLTVSDRPGQKLVCVCEKLPAIKSAMKWTETLSITFSAYGIPYWQDDVPTSGTLSSQTGEAAAGTIFVPGNAEKAYMNVDVTAGAALTSLSVACGNSGIQLVFPNDSPLASGSVVKFAYNADGILSIKTGSTSLLDKRTAASSDNLEVKCGMNNGIAVEATGAVSAVFKARGCWL